MKKIVIRMRGGLGNQLFIIAFAYKLITEDRTNNYELVIDSREYKTYKVRNFEILELIDDEHIRLLNRDDVCIWADLTRKLYHLGQKIFCFDDKMFTILSKYGLYYSKRCGRGYIRSKRQVNFLFGYFQDVYGLENIKEYLIDVMKYKINYNENHVKTIAISIRCGDDYVSNGWPICDSDYYKRGLGYLINNKYHNSDFKVLIFADDIEKAKAMNIYTSAEYIIGFSAIEQLQLMSSCNDFVISNSSFAWWGAFLGLDNSKIVYSPEYWYNRKQLTKETYLYYENMVIGD